MNRIDFDKFRAKLEYPFMLIDVDSKSEQVEIRRIRSASHRRYNRTIFNYASSLACRCHWSEASAWCHGFRYGYDESLSNLSDSDQDDNADVIEKLEKLNLYLYFDRNAKEPAKFHVVSNENNGPRWENRTLLGDSPPENTPTYRTLSEVERWWEGRLYGIAEQKRDKENV